MSRMLRFPDMAALEAIKAKSQVRSHSLNGERATKPHRMTGEEVKRAQRKGPVASTAETALLHQIRAVLLPEPEREVCLIEGRKYRWDFVWRPKLVGADTVSAPRRVAVEVQGGIWREKGAHNTGTAIMRDCEKANLAALAGYRTLFVTPQHIKDGRALQWISEALL